MKLFARYLLCVCALAITSAANLFAYKIRVRNNTNLSLTLRPYPPVGVACDLKGGTVTPGETWETDTIGCCTNHVEVRHLKPDGKLADKVNSYRPTLAANMACHDYEFSIFLDKDGYLLFQEGLTDPDAAAKISQAIKALSETKK